MKKKKKVKTKLYFLHLIDVNDVIPNILNMFHPLF